MTINFQTLELLEKIAAANGVAVDDFLVPQRNRQADFNSGPRRACRSAAMLVRFIKAYLALPGTESRLRAVRMMEAMAERAQHSR